MIRVLTPYIPLGLATVESQEFSSVLPRVCTAQLLESSPGPDLAGCWSQELGIKLRNSDMDDCGLSQNNRILLGFFFCVCVCERNCVLKR